MTIITDNSNLSSQSPIQKFYAGRSVLISGGTGFLGKLLIEKLIRSCRDINAIYILIRSKKGQNIHSRLDSIFDNPVFNVLKSEVPKFRHKIVPVEGDCSLPGLGISHADKELLLREVSIVFNVAATVRFDEKLKQAIAINVGGTKEMLNLCRCMRNLKAVIHVSTAYSNCNKHKIEEKFYDPPITGDNAIQLAQSLDEDNLDAITETLLGNFPNTYTYTKCIAEQIVRQYGKDLPTGIFRPAIVISSYREPVPGWIDNVYGPTGALVGGGAGLLRTLNIDANCTAELVPADLTVNALIATAWDVTNKKNEEADPPIYNYHSSWSNYVTWGNYIDLAFKYGKKIPSTRSIWCYSMTSTKNIYLYYVLSILLHIIPALLIDMGLYLIGKTPRMLKMYKKIHKFSMVTAYFSTTNWKFSNENTKTLWENLSDGDKEIFFFSMDNFDWEDFMEKCVIGLRVYVFKDDPDSIPIARKRMARIVLLHRFIKYTGLALAVWLLYGVFSVIISIGSKIGFLSLHENFIIR